MVRYNDFGLVDAMTVANFGISKEVPAWLTPRVNAIKGLTNMAHYGGVPWRLAAVMPHSSCMATVYVS